MKPRMVILNKQEYFEKFDQALAYSLEGEHQKSLNLLLELKEKRWINFELFYKIAEEYVFLDRLQLAEDILKQTKPKSEDDNKKLIELKQCIMSKLLQQLNLEDQELFKEKTQLLIMKRRIEQFDLSQKNKKTIKQGIEILMNSTKDVQEFAWLNQSFFYFGYYKICYEQLICNKIEQLDITEIDQQGMLIFERFLCLHYYQQVLDLLSIKNDDPTTLLYKGFCYEQMKQYKLALDCYKKSLLLEQNSLLHCKVFNIQTLLNSYRPVDLSAFPASQYINLYVTCKSFSKLVYKFFKQNQFILMNTNPPKVAVKYYISLNQNCTMFLYHELFHLEYLSDKQHPILQQICDHLIKYAPRYAAGYANQYVLFIDQQRFQEAYQLAGPLFECEDSTLKFITLAKIYLVQYRNTVSSNDFNTQAHLVLEQAKEINQYEEDIYILKREVYYAEKNYQEVRQTERFLVKLEKENYLFICQLIAPIINKFEYYRAFDLFQFGDEENARLNELKLLMQIISKPANQDRESIIKSLDEIESTSKFTFFGHYWLSQGDINQAKEYYQLSMNQRVESEHMFHMYTYGIEYLSNNQQNLNQYKILNIIWQISVYTYEPIEQEKYFHKRFVDTLGFSLQQICQFINSKYDVEVPHLKDFKSVLFKSVYAIYCLDHISIDQYSGYIETGIKQLQKLLISPEQSMELFYQFCSVKKNEIVNLMNFQNNQPAKVNLILKEIYSIPFFYDPVSKIALLTAIKMIGYFVDNDLANNYQNMEEWLGAYMLKQNVEAYYRTIIKQRHLN